MHKVFSVLSDTLTQSLRPLVVTDVLVKSAPFCNQLFFQLVAITDRVVKSRLDSLLQNVPDCLVNRAEVRAVRWPVL